jgi:hypothetical protein
MPYRKRELVPSQMRQSFLITSREHRENDVRETLLIQTIHLQEEWSMRIRALQLHDMRTIHIRMREWVEDHSTKFVLRILRHQFGEIR